MRAERIWGVVALVVALVIGGSAQTAPPVQRRTQALIEAQAFAWLSGRAPYGLRIEGKPDNEAGLPTLRVAGLDGPPLVVRAEGGLVPYAEGLLPPLASHPGQTLASRYVYSSASLRDREGRPLIVVFGYAFASDPGAIRVVGLDSARRPRVLLADETFALADVRDLDGDGVPELIGRRSLSQTSGECRATYDPYAVYRLGASGELRFRYSERLSRKYNLGHYVWAGPRAREDIAVSGCGRPPKIVRPRP